MISGVADQTTSFQTARFSRSCVMSRVTFVILLYVNTHNYVNWRNVMFLFNSVKHIFGLIKFSNVGVKSSPNLSYDLIAVLISLRKHIYLEAILFLYGYIYCVYPYSNQVPLSFGWVYIYVTETMLSLVNIIMACRNWNQSVMCRKFPSNRCSWRDHLHGCHHLALQGHKLIAW